MSAPSVTRGRGLVEAFLARQRARVANRLVPPAARQGRLLDIGCGSYPWFLLNTAFAERYGLDKVVRENARAEGAFPGLKLVAHDLERDPTLAFGAECFDVVTMLAVFEHIEPAALVGVLREVRRVLRPGGAYILTTPAGWTDRLIRATARLGLVSREEVEEHKDAYTHEKIAALLREAGFAPDGMRFGTFELGMNLWAVARK